MNGQRAFERIVARSIESTGVPQPSDDAVERTIASVSRRRQRPRWLALIKEPPMRTGSHLAVGSPTARVAAIVAATLMASVMLVSASLAGAELLAGDRSIVVDQSGDGDFTSITEAVEAAGDGDMISVRPGTYAESVVVDKDVVISGVTDEPGAVVIAITDAAPFADYAGSPLRYAFWIEAGAPEIGHLTIRGPGEAVSAFVISGGQPLVHDIVAEIDPRPDAPQGSVTRRFATVGGDAGGFLRANATDAQLAIAGSATPRIEGNDIASEIWVLDSSGPDITNNHVASVWVRDASAPVIEGNLIDNAEAGDWYDCAIMLNSPDTSPTIIDNVIRNAPTGLCIEDGNAVAVTGNEFVDNDIGISATNTDTVFADNVIHGGLAGVVVAGTTSPSFVGNTVEGAQNRGISIGSRSSPVMRDNTLCGSGTDLYLHPQAQADVDGSNEICSD